MLVGMVHLPALPGAPRSALSMDAILTRAVGEAKVLADAGFDAVMLENFGDTPFVAEHAPPETVAAMAIVARAVREQVECQIGVNVLRNDAFSALGIAAAADAAFIRVNVLSGVYATDQGMIRGRAREVLAARKRLSPDVLIAADVHVKHAAPISQPDIALAAEETAYRAGADILIVSGTSTGVATNVDDIRRVKAAVKDRPVWIGSGVDAKSVAGLLAIAEGAIVGTSLKRGGRTTAELDRKRIREFMKAARR